MHLLFLCLFDLVNLEGFYLSDKPDVLDKWRFPNVEIPANGFLVLFASGKDFVGQKIHTNFKLSKEGENLVLSNPQLEPVDQISVPALSEDQSYGRQPDGSNTQNYFFDPSPGSSNNDQASYNFASPPIFDNEQFFSNESIKVSISCPHP